MGFITKYIFLSLFPRRREEQRPASGSCSGSRKHAENKGEEEEAGVEPGARGGAILVSGSLAKAIQMDLTCLMQVSSSRSNLCSQIMLLPS